MGAEQFTLLAVLEAQDRASAVIDRYDGALDRFAATAERAATSARASGAGIDAGLLETASGADALELSAAKVSVAEERLTASTRAQAEAEQALLRAREVAASEEEMAGAATALAAAEEKATVAARALSDAQAQQAAVTRAAAGESETAAASTASLSKGLGMAGLGMAIAGGLTVKAAGDFQSSVQHLVTDAGESQKNLQMVSAGILSIATSTGTSTTALSDAMYHIESAGYHGAQGLQLLKTAAQGAKVGGADFETVAKTLTGTMNAYGLSGDQATSMMNQLIAATGAGDMRMQDLASSLGNVAPLAAAAGISFDQVAGGIATMTAQNMSAQQATQDLANTIRSLSNPNKVAIDEMQQLGLDSNDVSQNMGKRGLTGTLEMLTQAVAAHTQGGQVLVDSLKSSKAAAADTQIMFKQLPASIQGSAKSLMDGSLSAKQWDAAVKGLPATQQKMAEQFAHVVDGSQAFNKQLASGSPAAQTYNAALSKLLGGSTGLNTALMLTGGRMETFKDSVATVGEAAKKGGSSVENWDKIQSTFNQKLSVAKASVQAAAVAIGTMLLPAASKVASVIADVLGPLANWISHNQKLVGLILSVVAGAMAAVGVIKTIALVTKLWAAAQALLNVVMDANPIGLIVIALAALAAGIYYAWTHFKTFREVVEVSLAAVKMAALAVWHALEAAWHGIAAGAAWLGSLLVGAFDGIVGAAMAVWHGLETAWRAVSSVTSAVFGAIFGFFSKWWPLLLVIFAKPIADLISAWNHWHAEAFAIAKAAWGEISGFFVSLWQDIAGAASAGWRLFSKYILDPIEEVTSWLHGKWLEVARWLQGQWAVFAAVAGAAWREIRQLIIDPLIDCWHQVTGVADKIGSAIGSAFKSAKDFVMGIVHDFESVGSDIVHGIVKGVSGAAHLLTDKLKGLANDALGAAKSFLGISSPSREFADQVGKWIPHGIAKGITDHAAVAASAVSGLASSLPSAAVTALAPVGASAAGLGGGLRANTASGAGGGPTIVFDLRGSQVMSDRDMDAFVDKLGRLVATTKLPTGGVRLST